MSSCKPPSDYLSVPDVRKKCYKIPPENELCLCEDIFQQHQAKLINCDVEDASAVESYKDPDVDSNDENVCGQGENRGGEAVESLSRSSSLSSSSSSVAGTENNGKNGAAEQPAAVVGSREKLTAEERDKVLRELEDIVTGNFLTKVRRFSQDMHSDSSAGDDHRGGGQLQLTSAAAASRLRGKRSSSLDTDEIVNYGKVAELTRRFSRLGESGVIVPRHYRSESDFFGDSAAATSVCHFRRPYQSSSSSSSSIGGVGGGGEGDVVSSSGDDYEVVRQPIRMVFIRPMSVSDDRLNKSSGGGAVLTEVTSDGENEAHRQQQRNATQNRRRSFRKSVAFDSSLSSVDGGGSGVEGAGADCGSGDNDVAVDRYQRLNGGGTQQPQTDRHWQPVMVQADAVAAANYSKSSDAVSVSTFCRSHRRYSSVDVYDQVNNVVFLDVEKTEKEFRDGLLAEKNRRREAIREYMANKELLLMKMKSASVGGVHLRWNQEHQDTLLDDEESPQSPPAAVADDSDGGSTSPPPPKDGLRRVLRTGLKGRRIRKLRKLESRSSGLAVADLWRVVGNRDVPPPPPSSSSSRHSAAGCCSSAAEPPDNHNNTL